MSRTAVFLVAAAIAASLLSPNVNALAARRARPRQHPPQTLTVAEGTRLLVVAPHPDDEMLAAGGLMQRVHETGGTVRVVYLTDGDGYPEGVQQQDGHVGPPTPADFRGYGRRRRHEAEAAVSRLGLDKSSCTFLGFPDGALCKLMRTYWSDRRAAYRSPYTRLDRPPRAEILVPDTEYRGEDLTQELAQIIGALRPTMILLPRKEDQHGDHCAAWFFVADALTDVQRVHPDFTTDVVTYIVHFNAWPFQHDGARLDPPPGLRGGASGWLRLPLTAEETRSKRLALRQYKTQVRAMDWVLAGFARSNEVFSRPAPFRVVLPSRRSPCCDR